MKYDKTMRIPTMKLLLLPILTVLISCSGKQEFDFEESFKKDLTQYFEYIKVNDMDNMNLYTIQPNDFIKIVDSLSNLIYINDNTRNLSKSEIKKNVRLHIGIYRNKADNVKFLKGFKRDIDPAEWKDISIDFVKIIKPRQEEGLLIGSFDIYYRNNKNSRVLYSTDNCTYMVLNDKIYLNLDDDISRSENASLDKFRKALKKQNRESEKVEGYENVEFKIIDF